MNKERRATLTFAATQVREIRSLTGQPAPLIAANVVRSLRSFADLPRISGDEVLAAYEKDRERRKARQIARQNGTTPRPRRAKVLRADGTYRVPSRSAVPLSAPANVTRLNALLKAMGEEVRVARHWDATSLYFHSGDAEHWYSSTVGIARASNQSLLDWLKDLASLRTDSRNWKGPYDVNAETSRLITAALQTGRVTR